MNIIVISDSHGAVGNFDSIKDELRDCDFCIHLGDCTTDADYIKRIANRNVCSIRGNCDYSTISPLETMIDICGKKVFCTHGHKFNVKYSLDRLKMYTISIEADIILFGHTHSPEIFYYESKLFINPGSIYSNRNISGKSYCNIEIINREFIPNIIYI